MTGFVLAGGQSRRMGRDKALIPWQGATLLDHAIARLRAACGAVRVLCGPQPRYAEHGVPVDVDALPDAGALAGVYTGLRRGPGVFLAVDLPRVTAPLLVRLGELLSDYDAVVPVGPAGPEPLCAAYGLACLGPIRRRIEQGDAKMTAFWPDVRVRQIGPAELRGFGDPAELFLNLNAPEDLDRLRAR